MRKNLRSKAIILIITASLFLLTTQFVGATGKPVTDITSYMYYVQQLKKLSSMYNQAKQLKSGNFSRLEKVSDQLTGTYNVGQGLNDNLKDIQEGYEDIESGKMSNMDEYQDFLKDIEGYTNSNDLVSIVWNGDKQVTPWRQQKIQRKVRQKKLKNIILDNEKRLEGIGDRMDKIKELGDKIDSTRNVKESQDLTNRLLIEILMTLNEQLITATNFYEAQAMMLYSGEQSDEQFKTEQKEMQKAEKNNRGSTHEQRSRELQSDTRTAKQRTKDKNNRLLLLMKKESAKNKK